MKIAKRLQLDGLIPETSNCFSQEDKEILVEPKNRPVAIKRLINKDLKTAKDKKDFQSTDFNTIEELDKKLDEFMLISTSGKHECRVCGRSFGRRSNLKEHAETHVQGLSFNCSFCEAVFTNRHSRRDHEYNSHKKTKTQYEEEKKRRREAQRDKTKAKYEEYLKRERKTKIQNDLLMMVYDSEDEKKPVQLKMAKEHLPQYPDQSPAP